MTSTAAWSAPPRSTIRRWRLEEICALPVADLRRRYGTFFVDDITASRGVASSVLTAWGFAYVTSIVWVKDGAPGLGYWVRRSARAAAPR